MAQSAICELLDVSKIYSGRAVVRHLNLTINMGEMVALAGVSGAGKTTVLNILGLLEAADRGVVRLFGEPAPRVGSAAANMLLRTRLAYLFQNFALIDNETVENNLRIAQTYVGGTHADKRARRREVLRRVGLEAAEHTKVYSLSGGEQQRVAIARILLKPCDLVLADEPTGSLDAANRDVVLEMLKGLNASGKTIVVVTHDAMVAQMCSRVVQLSPATPLVPSSPAAANPGPRQG